MPCGSNKATSRDRGLSDWRAVEPARNLRLLGIYTMSGFSSVGAIYQEKTSPAPDDVTLISESYELGIHSKTRTS